MDRRKFLSLTGTFTGGALLLPDFLHAYGTTGNPVVKGSPCVVFIQLFGGNDGLNTFIPVDDPLYYRYRPAIAISKADAISGHQGMAFHPALKNFADIQQAGHLSVIQNVGYPEPVRSHFRSQEIWQTAPSKQEFLNTGWLGRYLDVQCDGHMPTAAINIDSVDNLALKGREPNVMTVQNPERFRPGKAIQPGSLSDNPHLDFVMRIAENVSEGSAAIEKALVKAPAGASYPKTSLGKNLQWLARLIKGNLNTQVYYTSQSGYDTHDHQLGLHRNKLAELNDAVFGFYSDIRAAGLLDHVTLVVFSEFGRRVKDNGQGTDHGTAAPMFVIGGKNKGQVIGKNPDLVNLDKGDLIYQTDFRSVYASLLTKLDFDARKIGISHPTLSGLF